MKKAFRIIQTQTEDFNLFTRVLVNLTLLLIAACVVSLLIGLAIQGEPTNFSY